MECVYSVLAVAFWACLIVCFTRSKCPKTKEQKDEHEYYGDY